MFPRKGQTFTAPDSDEDEQEPMMKKPLIKPSRRGLLHRKLGVPQGQTIPEAMLAKAKRSKSPALRKEAVFAQNFGH